MGYVVAELRREYETGDRILKRQVQELEQIVTELSEQVSIFNHVAAGCDAVLNAALVWIKQSK
jgi:hypothetical protein